MSGRVTGIGGVFFKCRDVEGTKAWYREALGVPMEDAYGAAFAYPDRDASGGGYSVLGPFPSRTRYFEPSDRGFMINLRVEGLDAILARLEAVGAPRIGEVETHEYGRFAWVLDPEGVKIELWEPSGVLPEDLSGA
jgi:predicted enzyme related to lactoylglutathione lyase